MRTVLGLAAATFAATAHGAPCAASSGPGTAALVELYSSAGCPDCMRAERRIARAAARQALVALVIPVDGPSARRDAWLRERKLTALQRLALVSRPHVLVQGREFEAWDSPAFDAALEKVGARPARAALKLEIASVAADSLTVRAWAGGERRDLRLYLAAYVHDRESGLGRLAEWHGPFLVGAAPLERTLPLPLIARAADSGAAGFVHERGNGEVLQALMLAACP